MFNEQDKYIFDEFKQLFGLTYYDDKFEITNKRIFSYMTYFTLGEETNVWKPIPM